MPRSYFDLRGVAGSFPSALPRKGNMIVLVSRSNLFLTQLATKYTNIPRLILIFNLFPGGEVTFVNPVFAKVFVTLQTLQDSSGFYNILFLSSGRFVFEGSRPRLTCSGTTGRTFSVGNFCARLAGDLLTFTSNDDYKTLQINHVAKN